MNLPSLQDSCSLTTTVEDTSEDFLLDAIDEGQFPHTHEQAERWLELTRWAARELAEEVGRLRAEVAQLRDLEWRSA